MPRSSQPHHDGQDWHWPVEEVRPSRTESFRPESRGRSSGEPDSSGVPASGWALQVKAQLAALLVGHKLPGPVLRGVSTFED